MNSTVPRFFNLLISIWVSDETRRAESDTIGLALTETRQKNYLTFALILRNTISHPAHCGLFGIVCSNEKKGIIS